MSDDLLNATLIERHDLNDELSIVKVRPDVCEVSEFKPGQFAMLGFPREDTLTPSGNGKGRKPRMIRRAYSIASSAEVRDHVELFVVLVEEGKLTPRLWSVTQGGRLWMDDRIKGEFTMDGVPPGRDLVMVSTGTGIAPFISMLRTYAGQPYWRRLVVINGVRRATDLGYREELEQISRKDPNVIYIPLVSREPADSDWPGLRGRVQTVLDDDAAYERLVGAPLHPQQCHVFLCGNPDMITSAEASLLERGFITHKKNSPGNIHFERYW